jgi:hypothetical protein
MITIFKVAPQSESKLSMANNLIIGKTSTMKYLVALFKLRISELLSWKK